jgi:hypothetical protein
MHKLVKRLMKNKGYVASSPAVINYIENSYLQQLIVSFGENGVKYIVLNGDGVKDKNTLLNKFGQDVFDGHTPDGWDQLSDLFSNLISSVESPQTAFIWTNVDQMLNGGLEDLIVCADILTGITRKFYTQNLVHLNFFLGEGSNFPKPVEL